MGSNHLKSHQFHSFTCVLLEMYLSELSEGVQADYTSWYD